LNIVNESKCIPVIHWAQGTDTHLIPKYFPMWLRNQTHPFGKDLNYNDGLEFVNSTDLRPLHTLIRSLNNGSKKNLNILVIGDSRTAGHFITINEAKRARNGIIYGTDMYSNRKLACAGKCDTPNGDFGNGDCKPCAYPARFQEWLSRAYPNVNVTLNNMALPGYGSKTFVINKRSTLISITDVDLIIVSFSANDRAHLRNDPSRMNIVAAGFEELIRLLLHMPSSPVIIIFEATLPEYILPVHAMVAQHYHLPIISYENSILIIDPIQFPPAPKNISKDGLWAPLHSHIPHPEWPYHQFYADFFAFVWARQVYHVNNSTTNNVFFPSVSTLLTTPIQELVKLRTQLFELL
jgi:hypothetical protein